ncbi:hypothetical protein BD414DRAFT_459791 [Trametes punicea]|nr:hypothetical protein BD414DRAFT_459791 [Trametes punicea]
MSTENLTPLRRSSRLQAKATSTYAEDHISSPAGPSTARDEPKRPAKRPRKSASVIHDGEPKAESAKPLGPRGRRRLLSKLVDMPLDILFEIFGHLHPADLLHLSRTTKALRSVLMQRSAITIWRNARQNVEDLPDCPPDLSEPAYANLLFDQHCHFCIKARVMTALWTCRSRACKACLKEHFTQLFDLLVAASERMSPSPHQPIKTSSMVPMEYVSNKLLIPKRVANELLARIAECKGDEVALRELEKERVCAVKRLKESAALLTEWQIKQNHKRTMDLMEIRSRRRKQIIERLCWLGFGEDLKWMTYDRVEQFMEHPLVKQPKELTDRIWNNIKEPMIAFAQEARTERLMRERCAHYINRLSVVRDTVVRWLVHRPLWEPLPSIADFSYYTPGFRHIMGTPSDTFYKALDMPAAQLNALLQSAVRAWRSTMARKLYDMIVAATEPSAATTAVAAATPSLWNPDPAAAPAGEAEPTVNDIVSRVCSACTWFRCTNPGCNALLDYPRVLAHGCAHAAPALTLRPTTDREDLQNAYALVLDEQPWNFSRDKVVFDVQAAEAAAQVVRACGRDPACTDASAMRQDKTRLVCSLCSKGGMTCVMSWKRAVAHLCEHAREGRDAKLTLLSKRDTRIVLEREPARLLVPFGTLYRMYGCLRCRVGPPMTLSDVLDHCCDEHYVPFGVLEEDFDVHPDAEAEIGVPPNDMWYDASLFLTPIRR